MKAFFYCAIFILTISCSHDNQVSEQENSDSTMQEWFPDFPEKPFKNLTFQSDINEAVELIKKEGFNEKNAHHHFINNDEKVEIIFSEAEHLTIFKVFFIDRKESFFNELTGFFDENASKSDENSDFSLYSFEAQNTFFDVTIFNFENMIRLHFKPTVSH